VETSSVVWVSVCACVTACGTDVGVALIAEDTVAVDVCTDNGVVACPTDKLAVSPLCDTSSATATDVTRDMIEPVSVDVVDVVVLSSVDDTDTFCAIDVSTRSPAPIPPYVVVPYAAEPYVIYLVTICINNVDCWI
jgi:hypothetical protein